MFRGPIQECKWNHVGHRRKIDSQETRKTGPWLYMVMITNKTGSFVPLRYSIINNVVYVVLIALSKLQLSL